MSVSLLIIENPVQQDHLHSVECLPSEAFQKRRRVINLGDVQILRLELLIFPRLRKTIHEK
jgi:hypothetical protein